MDISESDSTSRYLEIILCKNQFTMRKIQLTIGLELLHIKNVEERTPKVQE